MSVVVYKFCKTKTGVKLHLRLVFMEKGTSYPEKAIMTIAKEHERGQLEVNVNGLSFKI